MFLDSKLTSVVNRIRPLAVALALLISALTASAQEIDITKKLDGFDSYMAQILKDWNTPGIGVGTVEMNFNPHETLARLSIKADLANYQRLEP